LEKVGSDELGLQESFIDHPKHKKGPHSQPSADHTKREKKKFGASKRRRERGEKLLPEDKQSILRYGAWGKGAREKIIPHEQKEKRKRPLSFEAGEGGEKNLRWREFAENRDTPIAPPNQYPAKKSASPKHERRGERTLY